MDSKSIIFVYYKDDKLMGFRADTFNTITKNRPKVYSYSKDQVDVVIENIKQGCLVRHLSKTEETFRQWNEFEMRVHVISISGEEFYSYGEGEEWKRDQILNNLEPAIETYKFKIIDNEN